jgi:SAM-dependent methyltransferase
MARRSGDGARVQEIEGAIGRLRGGAGAAATDGSGRGWCGSGRLPAFPGIMVGGGGIANPMSGWDTPDARRDQAKVVSRVCPICSSDSYREVLRHKEWRLVSCDSCQLLYLREHPSREAIDTDFEWTSSFARQRWERWARNPFMRMWTFGVLWLKASRERRALRFIQRYAPAGRMLDIGCGNGRLLGLAAHRGYEVLGIESSAKMVAGALRRLPATAVIHGRLAETDLPPGSFDIAVTVSYLEHDPQPAQTLRQIHSLLRPGGFCIHKVPNYDSLLRRVLGRRWSGYRWPEHMQYYTPKTLGRLLTDSAFAIVALKANPLSDNFWIVGQKRTSE